MVVGRGEARVGWRRVSTTRAWAPRCLCIRKGRGKATVRDMNGVDLAWPGCGVGKVATRRLGCTRRPARRDIPRPPFQDSGPCRGFENETHTAAAHFQVCAREMPPSLCSIDRSRSTPSGRGAVDHGSAPCMRAWLQTHPPAAAAATAARSRPGRPTRKRDDASRCNPAQSPASSMHARMLGVVALLSFTPSLFFAVFYRIKNIPPSIGGAYVPNNDHHHPPGWGPTASTNISLSARTCLSPSTLGLFPLVPAAAIHTLSTAHTFTHPVNPPRLL